MSDHDPRIDAYIARAAPFAQSSFAARKTAEPKPPPEAFKAFPPGHKREYVEWMAEGKPRNRKYM